MAAMLKQKVQVGKKRRKKSHLPKKVAVGPPVSRQQFLAR